MDTSPFGSILHTNMVPSDAECQSIHDLLVGPRKSLSDLNEEIGRIQAELEQFTRKRDELENFIHSHEALLSPMRRLPDDTLRDIFVASLPSARYSTLSAADPPLLLCRISQRWRSLALSTPRLWTSLHLALPPVEDSRTAHGPELRQIDDAVKKWLSRSGSLPLSISFVVPRSTSGYYPISQLLGSFMHHSRRWNSIRFNFPNNHLFAGFGILSPADVPLLRSVVISPGLFNDNSGSLSFLSFLGAPKLQRLSLLNHNYDDLPVRWDALQHISFQMPGFGVTRAIEALRQCPALETCTIEIDRFASHDAPVVSEPCYLGHLQRLSVVEICPGPDLFQYLVLPSLRCLESSHVGPERLPPGPLPCFSVVHSTPCLESLHLRVSTLTTEALVAGLRLIPMLKELRISGEPPILDNDSMFPEYDPGLLPLLTPSSSSPRDAILCPCLQHITLLHFSAMSDTVLLAFFLARTDPTLPLDAYLTSARVRIDRPPDSNIDILSVLQQRIHDGFELALEYGAHVSSWNWRNAQFSHSISSTSWNQDESHDWDPVFFEWQPLARMGHPPPPI
ncbi:hypothetical protein C8R45DRAFT_1217887 [Mycena sanguinolenta]|nr:hypothetical protein C8R45DRAFT_1217887 [Mycena sanguinolenta]